MSAECEEFEYACRAGLLARQTWRAQALRSAHAGITLIATEDSGTGLKLQAVTMAEKDCSGKKAGRQEFKAASMQGGRWPCSSEHIPAG